MKIETRERYTDDSCIEIETFCAYVSDDGKREAVECFDGWMCFERSTVIGWKKPVTTGHENARRWIERYENAG